MIIQIVEPYFTGSHASWADGYARHSRHEVRVLKLSGQFWKWRMHGGAVTLARKYLEEGFHPDVILATDMLDLTTFLSLTRERTAGIPVGLYFHENQLTYPWSPGDRDVQQQRDRHYGFINYVSALAAEAVFFNSAFHRESFLEELPRLLRHFPDFREMANVKHIREKSRVLHLGFDFARLEECHSRMPPYGTQAGRPPLILWNHRWEYDKNPEAFFNALFAAADAGLAFEVAVLGENFSQSPAVFDKARERLGERVVQFGFVDSFADYAGWLHAADVLPVTSNHDFFGMSVVEAVACGCRPLLPHRLSYPEIFPPDFWSEFYYESDSDLKAKLEETVRKGKRMQDCSLKKRIERLSWPALAPCYDDVLNSMK